MTDPEQRVCVFVDKEREGLGSRNIAGIKKGVFVCETIVYQLLLFV